MRLDHAQLDRLLQELVGLAKSIGNILKASIMNIETRQQRRPTSVDIGVQMSSIPAI